VVLFFHGGGWVLGDLDTHDGLCRRLALASSAVVVSVAYRLAPEHPYPAAVDDAWDALGWVADHAGEIGGDPSLLAVAGDSSGGNVAAALALRARDRGGPTVGAQVLLYPPLDGRCDSPSYAARADDGGTITRTQMQWFWAQYAGGADVDDPLLSPLRADVAGLPPTLVVVAGFDPLRDDGRAYAGRLADAGVPVQLEEYPDTFHGFLGFDMLPEAQQALASVADWLGRWRAGWPPDLPPDGEAGRAGGG